jgi:vacuolar-type H+-ATPase subunit I/STV1
MKLKLIALLLVFASCNTFKKNTQDVVVVEDSTVKNLKHQIDSLKIEIFELKDQNDNMKDLLRVKDGEVSYWGQKYSSLNDSINKVKSKK